jgi:nucleoside-diphosphate-sugar epimerase
MKALVTGATGFIGSHLCEELIRRGYKVSCLVRKTSDLKWLENLDIKFITGDCTCIDSFSGIAPDFDFIFHLAGLTRSLSKDAYFSVNSNGTECMIKAVSGMNPKPKRFIYLSSLAAVGPSKNGTPLSEDSIPAPVSNYGRSKLEGEKAVLKYKDKMPVTILRPPAVYGPRDKDFLLYFKLIKKGIFPMWGKCYYSMLYVDDLIQGMILCAERKEAEGKIYFLSDNNLYSNEDIAREMTFALNKKVTHLRVPKFIMPLFAFIGEKINKQGIINRDRMNDLKYSHWICDSEKIKGELGFIPKVGIKEGIKWTADWYRIHRWL